jgi:perosamine synthetase
MECLQAYERLEVDFAAWARVENVVACSSGTAALHLALEALTLPLGSEVLLPDFTMVACARAVTLAGLTPVFVDCGDDLLMNPGLIDRAISARTKIIMAVHLFGRRCDMGALRSRADKYGLDVVEDLAEAHGIHPHEDTAAACWSFYRNKIVAGEEGGAVSFYDDYPAGLARQLRSLGFTAAHDFQHVPRGHNYRLSNAHAALILPSLMNVEANLRSRRQIEQWYDSACPSEWRMPVRCVPWMYDLRIRGLTRARQDQIVEHLNAAGIAARRSFLPMSQQEEYRRARVVGRGRAATLAAEVFYLPIYPELTREDVERAVDLVVRVARE